MKPAEFESQFREYLGHIEEAKLRKAHHDQLRSIFIGFLAQALRSATNNQVSDLRRCVLNW